MTMESTQIALQLFAALSLGAMIGIERQWKARTAGLRTNALVSLGAASFVIFAVISFPNLDSVARIASYVVSGMGFLGAGVIMRDGGNIKGINTAATLWCSAAVGMFAGMNHIEAAALVAMFIFFTNIGLGPLNRFVNRRPLFHDAESEFSYTITVTCSRQSQKKLRQAIMSHVEKNHIIHLRKLASHAQADSTLMIIEAHMTTIGKYHVQIEKIVQSLSLSSAAKSVKWMSSSHVE